MTTAAAPVAVAVCHIDDLAPDLGVAALLGGTQIAIFRLDDDRVFAVQNICPFSAAAVMSRGITGSKGDIPTIASPLYKQVFSLVDGHCLVTMDQQPATGHSPDLVVYPVEVIDGVVVVHPPE